MTLVAALALALTIGTILLIRLVVRLLAWLWGEFRDELERLAQGD